MYNKSKEEMSIGNFGLTNLRAIPLQKYRQKRMKKVEQQPWLPSWTATEQASSSCENCFCNWNVKQVRQPTLGLIRGSRCSPDRSTEKWEIVRLL